MKLRSLLRYVRAWKAVNPLLHSKQLVKRFGISPSDAAYLLRLNYARTLKREARAKKRGSS